MPEPDAATCSCGHPLGDHQTPGAECVHSSEPGMACGCVTYRPAAAKHRYIGPAEPWFCKCRDDGHAVLRPAWHPFCSTCGATAPWYVRDGQEVRG